MVLRPAQNDNFLLYGHNSLLIDERIAAIRQQFDPTHLSTTVIDIQGADLAEIASACQSPPFFGGRRVVVLLNPIATSRKTVDAADDDAEPEATGRVSWSELSALLQSLPTTTVVVLRHDGLLSQAHYVYKAARALGWQIESFPIPFGDDLLAWVGQRAEKYGVTIEPRAAEELLQRLYPTSWQRPDRFSTDIPDLRLIDSEIAKLSCAADRELITVRDVQRLVVDRSGYTAFRLTDLAFGGNTEGALQELQEVVDSGEPADRVLGQIASEAAGRRAARLAAGLPRPAVASAAGLSEGRLRTMQSKQADGSLSVTRAIAEALREADAAVKTGKAAETSATITPLVAQIAEVARVPGRERRGR